MNPNPSYFLKRNKDGVGIIFYSKYIIKHNIDYITNIIKQ